MKPEVLKSLKRQLRYDSESGNFYWLVSKNSHAGRIQIGDVAGTEKDGYIIIGCDQNNYRAHRLAWLFMKGEFPEKGFELDHINGIRNDNRWSNLRIVTRSQNNMNMTESVSNKSGYKGVSFRKDTQKWHARIVIDRKTILLGNHPDIESAVKARKSAEDMYFDKFLRRS